jgi:hypothetical protein
MTRNNAAVLALASGIVLTLALAGPALAYLKAVQSPAYIINDNHRRLAEEVRENAYSPSIFADPVPPRGNPSEMDPCDADLIESAEKKGGVALEFARRTIVASDLLQEAADNAVMSANSPLNAMSWSELALLKGCMEASMLAPLCKSYVRNIRATDYKNREEAINIKKVAESHRSVKDRCLMASYLKSRL